MREYWTEMNIQFQSHKFFVVQLLSGDVIRSDIFLLYLCIVFNVIT
jgi:hypothetical protein